jgi:hypothetical protein
VNLNIFPGTLAKIFVWEYNRKHIKLLSKLNQISDCIMNISELRTKFFPQEVSSSYQLVKLTVISPFFRKDFFEPLIEKNTDILLVTDFRSKLKADIISRDFPNIKCVLSETNTPKYVYVVHAKIFFFEWKNITTSQNHFILLWGSCNATANATSHGFVGDNAEVHSWCDVSVGHPEIIDYFRKIQGMSSQAKISGQIPAVNTQLNSVSLYLPALTLVENVDDFESWLESGFLWHPLKQKLFGTLRAKFKKPLAQELTAVIREDSNLKVADPKSISYSYLEEDIKRNLKDIQLPEEHLEYLHNTKKFSVETIYGFWVSKEFKESFQPISDKQRLEIINRIKNSTMEEQEEWIRSFFNQLQHSLDNFIQKAKGKDPSEYFHIVMDGQTVKIDEQKYRKEDKLDTQIGNDIALCKDSSFENSYSSGLSGRCFSAVPPIRFYYDAWDRFPKKNSDSSIKDEDFTNSFVSSWCQNLLEFMKKQKHKNQLSILIARLSKNTTFLNSEQLYNWLQSNWKVIQNELKYYYSYEKNKPISSGIKSKKKVSDDLTGNLF